MKFMVNTFNQYELTTLFYFLEALRGRWHFALYKYVTLLLLLSGSIVYTDIMVDAMTMESDTVLLSGFRKMAPRNIQLGMMTQSSQE